MKKARRRIIVEENLEALSERGARLFEQGAIESCMKSGRFAVALSGGSTPRKMHKKLALFSSIPWHGIHIFWGDERCVPADDPSSNYGAAWEDFIGKLILRPEQIHRMPAQFNPQQGASMAEKALEQFFSLKQGQLPVFDLIFLGLGKDGHTASLFPGDQALNQQERLVVAVKGGDPDVYRLTLTLPVINRAREVIFMVSGLEKGGAVKAVIEAGDQAFPASRVRPASGGLTWLLDRDAASQLEDEPLSLEGPVP